MTNRLSASEVYSLARKAGFTKTEARIMTVISFYESNGWDADAHNPNASTGDNSYGLWQINMLGDMGPERRKAFGISSNDQLFDPLTNAKAARMIYKWQGYGAWSVYRHRGNYNSWGSKTLQVAQASNKAEGKLGSYVPPGRSENSVGTPTAESPITPVPPTVDDPATQEDESKGGGIFGGIKNWVLGWFFRVALFAAGLVITLAGLTLLSQSQSPLGAAA